MRFLVCDRAGDIWGELCSLSGSLGAFASEYGIGCVLGSGASGEAGARTLDGGGVSLYRELSVT